MHFGDTPYTTASRGTQDSSLFTRVQTLVTNQVRARYSDAAMPTFRFVTTPSDAPPQRYRQIRELFNQLEPVVELGWQASCLIRELFN
eukprot:6350895-Pyramimonas_sp.AAC.1